jgi:hypothetical protein
METVIGVILLLTYFAFIVYAAKGGNLMIGLFIMAVLWSALGVVGGVVDWNTINSTIFDGGPTGFGPTAIYIIFGSWFGRILIDTGIAGTIIRKAVELGGDRPALTAVLLCAVVALIFTTAYGPGAVVAIGVIVFPILLSLGISKSLSTGAFVMSVGCGLYFNQSLLTQAAATMLGSDGTTQYLSTAEEWAQWYNFAFPAFALHFLSIVIMIIITMKFVERRGKVHAWAAPAAGGIADSGRNVSGLACLTPIIPVAIAIAFGVKQIPAIVLAVIFALLTTGSFKRGYDGIRELVQKTFHDGVADVGLVLAFLMAVQMFVKAAGATKSLLAPIVSPIIPSNTFVLFLIFGLLGFLALYRGPLTIWGAGVATFAIVQTATGLPLSVLYPLFYIPCCTITTSVCPTQSWNVWAIGYTKVSVKDFMKQCLPYALPCAFVLEIVAYLMFAA